MNLQHRSEVSHQRKIWLAQPPFKPTQVFPRDHRSEVLLTEIA